jgi:3',5'-cyclic AMP phosphodiesterase CpdA
MGARHDLTAWSDRELKRLAELSAQGASAGEVTAALNREFHKGVPIRTTSAVTLKRTKHGIKVAERPRDVVSLAQREQAVEQTAGPDGIVARANGSRIKTVADLLAHIEADLERFDVAESQATKYEVATKDPETGEVATTELHRVFVKLKPKAGPTLEERVEAIIAGAFAVRKPSTRAIPKGTGTRADLLQGVVIADPHIAKLAWGEGTGHVSYDTNLAVKVIRDGVGALLEAGRERRVGSRHVWLLGDYFHHDGQGATTKGTVLDYDTRVQQMLKRGADVLCEVIEASALQVPTKVILVPGNHDRTLTWALQRILIAEFRKASGVTIDDSPTTTKYIQHGKTLIGLDHGDKGKKRLAEVMAAQCAVEWGQTIYREMHTGHLHGKAAIETFGGVTVRTHAALCPPDQYHADEKFSVSPRMIEGFVYHSGGALVGSDAWSPDLGSAPRRGTI